MARRHMEVGDVVVVDNERIHALGVVEKISGDSDLTGGLGNAATGNWAYRIRVVLGRKRADGSSLPSGDEVWLEDDPWQVHIDGEDGFTLPESFLGENVVDVLGCSGVTRKAPSDEQVATAHARRRRKRVASIVIAIICVIAVVSGAMASVRHHRQQVAMQRQQEAAQRQRERMQDLIDSTDSYVVELIRNCGDLPTIDAAYGTEYATVTLPVDPVDWNTLGCMVTSMGEEDTGANRYVLWTGLIGSVSTMLATRADLKSASWRTVMDVEARCAMGMDGGFFCDVRSGDESYGEDDSNDTPSEDGSASSEPSSSPADTTTGGAQQAAGEFNPDNVRGRWCRKDGTTCVIITPQTEGKATPLVLDTSQMGEENPLPSGQTTTLMGYNYQSQPSASDTEQQLRMITQYSYRIDCSMYGDEPCDGTTLHMADMAVGGTPGTGVKFEQMPLAVTRMGPTNELPVQGLDEANPPEHVAYLIIQPYGQTPDNSVSDDTVFYSRLT